MSVNFRNDLRYAKEFPEYETKGDIKKKNELLQRQLESALNQIKYLQRELLQKKIEDNAKIITLKQENNSLRMSRVLNDFRV